MYSLLLLRGTSLRLFSSRIAVRETSYANFFWMLTVRQLLKQLSVKYAGKWNPECFLWDTESVILTVPVIADGTSRNSSCFFSCLPEFPCGVRLSDSSLMSPIKSVSGIIAYGPCIVKRKYGCELCGKADCYKNRNKLNR